MLRRSHFSLSSKSKSKSAAESVAIYKKTSHPRIFTVDAITSPEKPYRGVVALIGWLFGKPKALSKYATVYAENGFDTVMVTGDWSHILMPEKCSKLMDSFEQEINARHLKHAVAHNKHDMERKVVLHAFSMGAFQTAIWLQNMRQSPQGHQTLSSIKCQIFDSPVDYAYAPRGIALAAAKNPIAVSAIEKTVSSALKIVPSIRKCHTECSDRFWNHSSEAPAMFFYSAEDEVSPDFISEGVMDVWRKKGMEVHGVSFSQTKHVCHMMHHPEKYRASMEMFLDKHVPAVAAATSEGKNHKKK